MKQTVDTTINLNMLFNTKIGNDILIKFIVNNKIANRKWILGQLDNEIAMTLISNKPTPKTSVPYILIY